MQSVVIAYVPVLHRGYISFFGAYPGGVLYILGTDLLREFEHLERDIRALSPEEMRIAVASLRIFSSVQVLDRASIVFLLGTSHRIIMPNEEVSRVIAGKYFPGRDVIFDSIFLRWDIQNTMSEKAISPDRKISCEDFDIEMMRHAESLAEQSPDWWRQVGALAVRDGVVLISAFNRHMPHEQSLYALGDPRGNFSWGERIELSNSLHAERSVIAQAARRGISVSGASLYVTTFPCPPCAMDIVEAGFSRLYYREGYSKVGAEDILRGGQIEIIKVET